MDYGCQRRQQASFLFVEIKAPNVQNVWKMKGRKVENGEIGSTTAVAPTTV